MESHLLQMRGLKLLFRMLLRQWQVASFTDAWIETSRFIRLPLTLDVASFTDAWIETLDLAKGFNSELGRIFYRCVD